MKTPIHDAFEKVKPACVDLTKNCSLDCLQRLSAICRDLDDSSLQLLQEYLIFPLRISLRTQKNQEIIIECINFINSLFRRTVIQSWNLFQDIIAQLYSFLGSPQQDLNTSEEMKHSVCDCVQSLVQNATSDILQKLYAYDYRMPLAQYVFTLLEILRKERSKPLRYVTLETLSSLLYINKNIVQDASIALQAGEQLSLFLPGVSLAFVDILTGDVKQGYAIFVTSLEIFGNFLVLIAGDEFVKENDIIKSDQKAENSRNSTWIKDISDKLKLVITKIIEVVSHEHWLVRQELAKFAEKILCGCNKNMAYSISPLLQALFILSVDDYEQVIATSKEALKKFSDNIKSLHSFNSILEEDIHSITSKLIKIHLSTNDAKKISLLKMLRGYFELIGESMNNLLYSFPHLDRFLLSLLSLIKFDYSDQNFLVEHMPSLNFASDFSRLWQTKRFKYFDDHQIVVQISSICSLLGYYGDVNLLVDALLEKLDSSYKNESVFIITCIMKGLSLKKFESDLLLKGKSRKAIDSELLKNINGIILDSLLSMGIWKDSLNCDFKAGSDSSLENKENILQLCLMLECIATCSKTIGTDFRVHLMQLLCPILEKAGSSNMMISQAGRLALLCIAKSCDYGSVTNLILENADYLVNSITINLDHFLSQPETVVVLRVIVDNSDVNILKLIKDPILKMLQMLDSYQEKSLLVLSVLKSVIMAIGKWFVNSETNKTTNTKLCIKSSGDLRSAIMDRHALKKTEMSFLDDYEDVNTDPEPAEEPVENSLLLSFHVEIITETLERCVHMLSSKKAELVVLALEIIDASIMALKGNSDKILPHVHKLWSPLLCRFSGNVLIMMKAFETLIIIANECGDFIKSRTMKSVWPKLLEFLKSQASVSLLKTNESDYCVTTAYKLQLLVLSEIGNFVQKLELSDKEFETVAWHCFPYLKENQPLVLQEAAKKSLASFAHINPDAMWFHYNEFFGCKCKLIPPNNHFRKVNFPAFSCEHLTNYYPGFMDG